MTKPRDDGAAQVINMPQNPCPFCRRNEATQLCDFVVDYVLTTHPKHFGRMSLTCDNPMCKECATNVAGHEFYPVCEKLHAHVRSHHKIFRI